MAKVNLVLAVFVSLTLIFASIAILEYSELSTRAAASTMSSQGQTSPSSEAFPATGLIEIDSHGNRTKFLYTRWNASMPAKFTFDGVVFSLSTNPTVTNSAGNCWVTGYGMFNVTFAGGASETLSPCTLGVATTITIQSGQTGPSVAFPNDLTMRFSNHVNPQAGLLIDLLTGDVYILVSA